MTEKTVNPTKQNPLLEKHTTPRDLVQKKGKFINYSKKMWSPVCVTQLTEQNRKRRPRQQKRELKVTKRPRMHPRRDSKLQRKQIGKRTL